MFDAAFKLIVAVWPYLRESLFEGGTVRQWLRKYKWTLIWLGLVFMMTMINFFMFDQYVKLQMERNKLLTDNQALYINYKSYQKALTIRLQEVLSLKYKVKELEDSLMLAKTDIVDTEEALLDHRKWDKACGINTADVENGVATCPNNRRSAPISIPKPPRPLTKPRPPKTTQLPDNYRYTIPQPPKKSFADKIKTIFGGGETSK